MQIKNLSLPLLTTVILSAYKAIQTNLLLLSAGNYTTRGRKIRF